MYGNTINTYGTNTGFVRGDLSQGGSQSQAKETSGPVAKTRRQSKKITDNTSSSWKTIKSDLDRGWSLIKNKAFTKAYKIFKRIHGQVDRAKKPQVDVASVKMGLALCEQNQGNFDEAISILRDVKRRFPKRDKADLVLARCYQASGDYEKALRIFEDLRKRMPRDKKVLNGLARCYEEAEKFDQAVQAFKKLKAMDPRNPEWKISLGYCLRGMGNYDGAIRAFKEIAEERPFDKKVTFGLIGCYESIGDLDEAASLYKNLLAGRPHHNARTIELALCYQKMGRFHEGIKVLRPLVSASQDILEIPLTLSRIYMKKRNYETSLAILSDLDKRHPKEKSVMLALAKCYAARQDARSALKVFDFLNVIFPNDKEVLLAQARFHAKRCEDDEAEILFSKLLELFPKDKEIHLKEAHFKLEEGKPEEALKKFSLLKKRFPYCMDAWIGYLLSVEKLKGPEAAIQLFEKYIATKFPYHPKILETVAKCFGRAGRYEEAIALLLKIRERSPFFPNSYDGLNICYEMSGQHENRRKILEEGIQILSYNLRLNCEYIRLLLDEEREEEAKEHATLCMRRFANDPSIQGTLDDVWLAHKEDNKPAYLKVPDIKDSLIRVRDYFQDLFFYQEAVLNYRRININGTLKEIFPKYDHSFAASWVESKLAEVDKKVARGGEVTVEYILAVFFAVLAYSEIPLSSTEEEFRVGSLKIIDVYREKSLIEDKQSASMIFRVMLMVKDLHQHASQPKPDASPQVYKVSSIARCEAKKTAKD